MTMNDDNEVIKITDPTQRWVKQVIIRKGVKDRKKLELLGRMLSAIVQHGKRDRAVRRTTVNVLQKMNVPAKDHVGEMKAVTHWVQNGIRYTFDPYGVEYFQTARRTLIDHVGDCDDESSLAAAMLGSIGYHAYIILLDSKGDGVYSHAMAGVKLPRSYPPFGLSVIPLELTKKVPVGWFTPKTTKMYVIDPETGKTEEKLLRR